MKNNSPEIICCGHAAYDINFMMPLYPVEDQKYRIDTLVETGGGPAANAACLNAKWGLSSAFAGLVGKDIYGDKILNELKEWNVDTSLVEQREQSNTPLSAIVVNTSSGTRTLLNRRDESEQSEVSEQLIERLSKMNPSILLFDGHALNLSLKLVEMFPRAVKIMDAGTLRNSTDTLSRLSDYVICSTAYACELAGLENLNTHVLQKKAVDVLTERYNGLSIVTMGKRGVCYRKNSAAITMPSYSVKAVDTTGAGDVFHGAFAYGIAKGLNLQKNLNFSSAAAALSTTKPGGRTSIPELEETLQLCGLSF